MNKHLIERKIIELYSMLHSEPHDHLSDADIDLMATLAGHPAIQTLLAAERHAQFHPVEPKA